ncbi:hypothetical protein Pelo_15570 [Pelomyxa schiedti]|nr:hypothetical protein Pelo_15570 [Pelomyxa schiedti]
MSSAAAQTTSSTASSTTAPTAPIIAKTKVVWRSYRYSIGGGCGSTSVYISFYYYTTSPGRGASKSTSTRQSEGGTVKEECIFEMPEKKVEELRKLNGMMPLEAEIEYRSNWMGSGRCDFQCSGILCMLSNCYGKLHITKLTRPASIESRPNVSITRRNPKAPKPITNSMEEGDNGEEEGQEAGMEEWDRSFDVFFLNDPTPTELASGWDDFVAMSAMWSDMADIRLVYNGGGCCCEERECGKRTGAKKEIYTLLSKLDRMALEGGDDVPYQTRKEVDLKSVIPANLWNAPVGTAVVFAFSRAAVMSSAIQRYILNTVFNGHPIADTVYIDGEDTVLESPHTSPKAFPRAPMVLSTDTSPSMLRANPVASPVSVMAVGKRTQIPRLEKLVSYIHKRQSRAAGSYTTEERTKPPPSPYEILQSPGAATHQWSPSGADLLEPIEAEEMPVFITSNACVWTDPPETVLQNYVRGGGESILHVPVVCVLPKSTGSGTIKFTLGEAFALVKPGSKKEIVVSQGQADCVEFLDNLFA